MKCFVHVERDAVGTCQTCGKTLCQECAMKYTPCTCDGCIVLQENDKRAKYKNSLVNSVQEFYTTLFMGVVVGLGACWLLANGDSHVDFFTYVLSFFWMATVPFGWKMLSFFQSFFPLMIIGTIWFWVIWTAIKFGLCLYIGPVAFVIQLIRMILTNNKSKKV